MIAIYSVWYNWMRKHKTHGMTPAIAAGITKDVMTMADIVLLLDQRELKQVEANRERILLPSN